MRFLVIVVLFYLLISWLPRCAQEVPQMAGNAASHAASGVAGRIGGMFGAQSPADQFEEVCDHIPVEGVDKVCPYFTAAMQGATKAQARQTACYLTAAGKAPNGQQTLQAIHQTCPQTPNNAAAFQSCVENYVNTNVESGDVSSCQPSSIEQFETKVHDIIEPIACIPGLPKSWCTTRSSSASTTTPDASQTTRTDQNYLYCLQKYYQLLPNYGEQLSCPNPTTVNAQNAACVRGALLSWTYQGQHFGVAQVQFCDDPQSDPP